MPAEIVALLEQVGTTASAAVSEQLRTTLREVVTDSRFDGRAGAPARSGRGSLSGERSRPCGSPTAVLAQPLALIVMVKVSEK